MNHAVMSIFYVYPCTYVQVFLEGRFLEVELWTKSKLLIGVATNSNSKGRMLFSPVPSSTE